jgi:hypothetical protein
MAVRIEVPERLVEALESYARHHRSSVEDVAIDAIEAAIGRDTGKGETENSAGRVRFPLIHSATPGSLRSLPNTEIDGILDQ